MFDPDNYIYEDLLGEGAYGQVFKAWDKRTGQTVAIKIVGLQNQDDESIEKIVKECQILQNITHPSVIRCYESGIIDDEYYSVLEFLQGRSLSEAVEDRCLPYTKALKIIKEIAEALVYLEKKGVVHRDIKADNVILSDLDGSVKLLDFGIAYDLNDPPVSEDIDDLLGTPYYFSPEYIQGARRAISPKMDVYSLGILLYVLIEGIFPFTGRSAAFILEKHLSQNPPRIEGVPLTVNYLFEDMLNKNPESRPSASQVISRIDAILRQDRRKFGI